MLTNEMERGNVKHSEWKLALTIKKQGIDSLLIEIDEGQGRRLVFTTWASLYHYLTQRFPEHRGFLR